MIDFRPGPRTGSRRRGDAESFERPAHRPRGRIRIAGASRAIDLEQLLAAARRKARVVGFAAAVGGLLGLAYAISATPLYTATTDLLIDSQKDKTELSASIAELTFDTGAIDSQVEVLKSEKIALAVIAALNLTHDPEFMGARGTLIGQALAALRSTLDFVGWFVSRERSVAEADESLQRAAIDQLRSGLDVRRIAHTYVLAIDYTSPDQVKSATIANAFGEAYLNDQLDGKFEATRQRRRLAAIAHRRTEAAVDEFRSRGAEVQGRQRNRRHRGRPAGPDVRPAAHPDQRADGAGARRHRARGGALPADRGSDQFRARRRLGSQFARQSGDHRPAREVSRRVEDGSSARRQARPPAPASHQSQERDAGVRTPDLRGIAADRRKLPQRRRGRARQGAVTRSGTIRTGGRECRHQPDVGPVARARARNRTPIAISIRHSCSAIKRRCSSNPSR